jgi:hypothetical protein
MRTTRPGLSGAGRSYPETWQAAAQVPATLPTALSGSWVAAYRSPISIAAAAGASTGTRT